MKKLYLLFLLIYTIQINAQCPITIAGKSSICIGVKDTLTANGATSYTWAPSGDTGTSIIVTPTVTTTYTIAANTGTCTTTNTINVVVHPLPTVTFTTNINFPYFNIYPTYSSNVTTASWEIHVDCYSMYPYATSGYHSNFYGLYPQQTMTLSNPGTSSYVTNYTLCVKVSDSFGCADTSSYWNWNLPNVYCEGKSPCTDCDTNSTPTIVYDVNVSQNQTTSINNLPINGNQVFIYPNPSNGIFNLSIIDFNKEKTNYIEINNLIGECVLHQIATSSHCQIDASNLPNGIYNISISSKEGVVNKRVVIAR